MGKFRGFLGAGVMNRILFAISRICTFVSSGFGLRILVLVMLVTSPSAPSDVFSDV